MDEAEQPLEPEQTELPPAVELIEGELAVVQLEQGDVICVFVDDSLSLGRRQYLRQQVEELFPGYKVAVFTDGTRLGVVRGITQDQKPESAEEESEQLP